ncbi:MAG: hypothetical protein KBS85_02975 [Lachnospiraceae bacterium]|nr:hypothetical protein [Candidatus Merdinaster equi]
MKKKVMKMKMAQALLAVVTTLTVLLSGGISARAAVYPNYYISPAVREGDTGVDIMDMSAESTEYGISSGDFAANKWICVGAGLTASFSGGLSYAEDVFEGSEPCYRFTSDVRFEVSGTTVTFIGTGSKAEPEHKHSFGWVVEREATEIYPGVKVNKCSECGYVSERVTLPVANKVLEKLNNSFETQLKSAQQGGTVTLELGDWNSLQNKFMKKIQDSKVDVTLKYNYKGKKYTIIIPANGFKDMGVEWYGPAFLYSIYGGTIED